MDAEVLRGLSPKPRFLSFEYNTNEVLAANTRQCFTEVRRLGYKEANFTKRSLPELLFESWIGMDNASERFEQWCADGAGWGDVILR